MVYFSPDDKLPYLCWMQWGNEGERHFQELRHPRGLQTQEEALLSRGDGMEGTFPRVSRNTIKDVCWAPIPGRPIQRFTQLILPIHKQDKTSKQDKTQSHFTDEEAEVQKSERTGLRPGNEKGEMLGF